MHATLVVGVSQTLRQETDGATYIWQGSHHVGVHSNFGDILPSQSLGTVLKKLNLTQQKPHTNKL